MGQGMGVQETEKGHQLNPKKHLHILILGFQTTFAKIHLLFTPLDPV